MITLVNKYLNQRNVAFKQIVEVKKNKDMLNIVLEKQLHKPIEQKLVAAS